MRVLVVEDEPDMSRLLGVRLSGAGFIADRVGSCAEALAAMSLAPYGVALVDRRLPDGDGASLIKPMRVSQPGLPVIVISALDSVRNRIDGLDAGADDYLIKPFDGDELLARIRAALRRRGATLAPPIVCGNLRFEAAHRSVSVGGTALKLRRRELAVLEALILRAGRVVSREHLVDCVFGFDDDIVPATLESHVSRLRATLAQRGAGVSIHPVRGVGYVLSAD
jgi:DNA-binding response OmpR family regulator